MAKNIIPEEYIRQNKEFDEQAYVQQRINEAVKKSYDREFGIPMPKWWIEKGYDPRHFANCIGTALDNYGIDVTGNETFAEDFEKYGFRKLDPKEVKSIGDIIQLTNMEGRPSHSLTLVGKNEKGEDIYNYGDGGIYSGRKGEFISTYKKEGLYPHEDYDEFATYRYIGNKDELEQIRKHNANVKNNNDLKNASKEHQDKFQKTAKVESISKDDTIKFLENIVKKQRL